VFIAGFWIIVPRPAEASDMMSTCKSEISEYCSGVSRGRGRILACLISHEGELGASCRGDVETTAKRGADDPLVPSGVRKLLGHGETVSVPSACSSDVSKFCSGISPGNENTLACLYAHSAQVSADCTQRVRAELD
jgi:hypothetical protein